MADNPEDCGAAWLSIFELAAFLSGHSWRDEGWDGEVDRVVVSWLARERYAEGRDRSSLFYIYLEPRLTRPQSASNVRPFPFTSRVTRFSTLSISLFRIYHPILFVPPLAPATYFLTPLVPL